MSVTLGEMPSAPASQRKARRTKARRALALRSRRPRMSVVPAMKASSYRGRSQWTGCGARLQGRRCDPGSRRQGGVEPGRCAAEIADMHKDGKKTVLIRVKSADETGSSPCRSATLKARRGEEWRPAWCRRARRPEELEPVRIDCHPNLLPAQPPAARLARIAGGGRGQRDTVPAFVFLMCGHDRDGRPGRLWSMPSRRGCCHPKVSGFTHAASRTD